MKIVIVLQAEEEEEEVAAMEEVIILSLESLFPFTCILGVFFVLPLGRGSGGGRDGGGGKHSIIDSFTLNHTLHYNQ